MRKSRITDDQIVTVVREAEGVADVGEGPAQEARRVGQR